MPGWARSATLGSAVALPAGLAVAIWTGPHDAQDGGDEQDGAGYIGADKGDSEDRGQDRKGGRRAQGTAAWIAR